MAERIEYRYSRVLEPTARANLPSFTSFPIRIGEANLSQRVRAHIRSLWMFLRYGKLYSLLETECPLGHVLSLIIPECPPGRIDLATEVFDYAFIQNDALETPESREAAEQSDKFDILASEVLGIDHPLPMAMMSAVHQYLMAKHEAIPTFRNFEEYIKYRVIHIGSSTLTLLVCILMNIPIGFEDLGKIHHITQPLDEYFALCNDYFSYWKEKEDTRGGEYPSAVTFLMKTQDISEDVALEIIKEKMIALEETHYSALRNSMAENTLSLEQQRFIHYLQLAQGGAHAFNCTAYRYNLDAAKRVNTKLETKRYVIWMVCLAALIVYLLSSFMFL